MPDSTLSEHSEKKEIPIHDLRTREIRPIQNWNEWLERWQAAVTLEEMVGLLHCGFTIPMEPSGWEEERYDGVDRAMFYFAIADGWGERALLVMPTDEGREYVFDGVEKRAWALRQVVAKKAFDMLCLNVFKLKLEGRPGYGEDFGPIWARDIASERLFRVIQNFFRAEKEGIGNGIRIRNLTDHSSLQRSHHELLAHDFLKNLAQFIWGWREDDTRYYSGKDKEDIEKRNAGIRIRLDAAKPWMVEVLMEISGGSELLRKWVLTLDKPCLVKLKEIALRSELNSYQGHPVVDSRKVATLDEACYAGSYAAWLLKWRELAMREGKRLETILKAKAQKREADRQIRELSAQQKNPR